MQLDTLPEGSVAVEVTVVLPTGKNEPEAGVVTKAAVQLSVAVTEKVTVAPHAPEGAFVVISDGQLMTGAWLSITITLNEHVATFPEPSVAVYVTTLVPFGKIAPGATLLVKVNVQLSVAVGGIQLTDFVHVPESVTVISAGQDEITGAILSITETLNEHVDALPVESVAVYITAVEPPGKIEPEE